MASTGETFIIDTCSLVNIHEAENCGRIWPHFVNLINSETVKTIQHVLDEFKRKWPEGYTEVAPYRRKILIEQYEEKIFQMSGQLSTNHPNLYLQYSNNQDIADPWIIAAAIVNGYKLVTDERRRGPGHQKRIPYIASLYGVVCYDWREFLQETGFNDF